MIKGFGRTAALMLSIGLLVAGCGSNSTSDTSTVSPSQVRTTDTFTGSLVLGGANVHPFAATAPGQVDATLNSVAPLATMAIGVGLGTWDGTTCTVVVTNDNTKAAQTVTGSAAKAVNLCLRVYDSGNVPDGTTVTYNISVLHP